MPFIQLDDQITEHPKILQAGAVAAWVWVSAIAYCQRQLTDGFVPDAALPRLAQEATPKVLARLVQLRLLDRVDGGYCVHDYLAHNPSRETVLRRRAEAAARKERSRGTRDGRVPERVPERVTDAPSRARIPTPTPTPTPTTPQTPLVVVSSVPQVRTGPEHMAAMELCEVWNGARGGTVNFADLMPDSVRRLRVAVQAKSLDEWERVFRRIDQSDYLAGRGDMPAVSLWKAIELSDRIAAGEYDNREAKTAPVVDYTPTKLRKAAGGVA